MAAKKPVKITSPSMPAAAKKPAAKPVPKPVVKAAQRATVKAPAKAPAKKPAAKAPAKKTTAKKTTAKKTTTAKRPTSSAAAAPAETEDGTFNPLAPPAPVGMPDGSLVDPNQWESDQARLMAAEEDNAEYDSLIAEEQDAVLTEQSDVATNEQKRAAARLSASQKLKQYQPVKVDRKKNLDNALSYRGMGRSSAYKRKNMQLKDEDTAVETGIAGEQAKAEQDYTTNVGLAAQRKQARLAAVTPRKNLLAQRGARAGVYTK